MAEAPNPVPLEEQVRQDQRFSSLAGISDSYVDTVSELLRRQQQDPENLHSKLWLDYARAANALFSGFHRDLVSIGESTAAHEQISKGDVDEWVKVVWMTDDRTIIGSEAFREYGVMVKGVIEEESFIDESAVFIRDLPQWLIEEFVQPNQI